MGETSPVRGEYIGVLSKRPTTVTTTRWSYFRRFIPKPRPAVIVRQPDNLSMQESGMVIVVAHLLAAGRQIDRRATLTHRAHSTTEEGSGRGSSIGSGRPTKWFGTWRSSKLPEAIKAGILAIVQLH